MKKFKSRLKFILFPALAAFCVLPILAANAAPNPDPAITYPQVEYGSGDKAEQIKRGEYLTRAGDCIACHTEHPGAPAFSGGLPIKTPFGTLYSPNITPDKETGIGQWSDEDFIRAMREGIDPKGHYYFPVFPYNYFNKLTRQDVLDIKAYLDAVPAVHQANRPNDMAWPFNIRLLQSFWRFMFFDFQKGEFVPDKKMPAEWNRGAYLVTGLGHCAMCHTPLNELGAPKQKYNLAGGFVEGYYAPNISGSRLKDIATGQVLGVFLNDKMIQGRPVQGPMLDVNHNSLRYVKIEDLSDIVTYLRTVQSKIPPAPKLATGEKAGGAVYEQYCAGCHTMGGGGAPKFGDAADWSPRVKQGMTNLYKNAIVGIGGMPAKGNCESCTDDQIKHAVDYIVEHSGSGNGQTTKPSFSPLSLTTLQKGKKVYNKVCSICHAEGLLGSPKMGDQAVWAPLLNKNIDVLITHTIEGYKGHPPKGACYECSDADIISAVKYMAQESSNGNYTLW